MRHYFGCWKVASAEPSLNLALQSFMLSGLKRPILSLACSMYSREGNAVVQFVDGMLQEKMILPYQLSAMVLQ